MDTNIKIFWLSEIGSNTLANWLQTISTVVEVATKYGLRASGDIYSPGVRRDSTSISLFAPDEETAKKAAEEMKNSFGQRYVHVHVQWTNPRRLVTISIPEFSQRLVERYKKREKADKLLAASMRSR